MEYASHRRGSDSEGGGVGTSASARALRPLYENVPYFGDVGGGYAKERSSDTEARVKTVRRIIDTERDASKTTASGVEDERDSDQYT
jgi:hypothetical protein